MEEENGKKAQQKVDELMKIIRWLDDYRRFRVANPASIENSILKICPSELVKMWKRVKKDINTMNDTLGESKLRKFIVLSVIMRSIAISSIMGFVALFLAVMSLRVSLTLSRGMLFVLTFICLVVIPNFYLYLDRYLRLKIREHYESLMLKYSSRMGKVKDFAQQLIFYMNSLIENFKLDINKNKFRLRHCDYKGLTLVKKRRFSEIYTVIPSLKTHDSTSFS